MTEPSILPMSLTKVIPIVRYEDLRVRLDETGGRECLDLPSLPAHCYRRTYSRSPGHAPVCSRGELTCQND